MLSLLALAIVLQNPLPSNPPPIGIYSSYLDGQRWNFEVSRSDIEQGPRWLAIDDSPPLPPGAAVRSAMALLPKLLPGEKTERWLVKSVSLQEILFPDAWVYIVAIDGPGPCAEFAPGPGGGGCGFSGPPREMRIVVLLNGKAVVPTSSPWTPNVPNRN